MTRSAASPGNGKSRELLPRLPDRYVLDLLFGLRLAADRAPIVPFPSDGRMPRVSGLERLPNAKAIRATNDKFAAVHRLRLMLRSVRGLSAIGSLSERSGQTRASALISSVANDP